MRSVLSLAHTTSSPSVRRAATASGLCYVFMLCEDSCVPQALTRVLHTPQGMTLQLHVKTRGRDVSTMVHQHGHDKIYHLIHDWVHLCSTPGQAALWTLPGRPLDTFTSLCVNRWFQESCPLLGLRPPQGEKWVGHWHLSGGATRALSIDASLPAIVCFGVWDDMVRV